MSRSVSDLMWHQTQRGGGFIHPVITAAGHCIAAKEGDRGGKNGTFSSQHMASLSLGEKTGCVTLAVFSRAFR